MVREVFSISKFLLKSEWLNRSGTNMWLSRKLDLRLVNFGAIDIKSWKYSDVSEEEEYWDFGLKKSVMSFLKLKWINGLLQTSVIEAKVIWLKSFFQRRSSRSKIENADSEWSPTAIVTFQVFLLFRILQKSLFGPWMNTFAHCLCYLSALELGQQGVLHLPSCAPQINISNVFTWHTNALFSF